MEKKVEIVKVRKEKNSDLRSYNITSIDSFFSLSGSGESDGASRGERALTHSFLMDTLRKIMGRTLTVIDASIHEEKQNKAIKDLIRGIVSDEMNFATDWAFDQQKLQEMFDDMSDSEIDNLETVTIEEALGVE